MAIDRTSEVVKKSISHHHNTIKESFPVLEMTCSACAISVESMLKSVPGVKDASVNFANHAATIEYLPSMVSPEDFQTTIRSIGYDLIIDRDNGAEIQEDAKNKYDRTLKTRTIWSSVLSLPIVVIGMFFMDLPGGNWIMMILATPVVFYFGKSFFISAWKKARQGKANMDSLVALSTGMAYVFSAFNTIYPQFWHSQGLHSHVYFEAAAVIIAFISLGKLLEEKAKSNTTSAIKKLIGLQPKTVTIILEDDQVDEIPISSVKPGYILLVKPGEKIPVDGRVTSGESYVDESMITGEPIALFKKRDHQVFAGTINQKGSFRFRAEKIGSETLLGHIIKMVKEAQGSKAPVQKLVDKIAGVFVPIILIIALLTFVAWSIVGDENGITRGLLSAVTVLVIACPCALGLATPTAIMVAIGKGAENNILIKDAESIEIAHKVNVIVLDKTGTITEGKPEVTDMIFMPGVDIANLKEVILSTELQSEHPLAGAITNKLLSEGVKKISMSSIKSETGKGVSAVYNGKRYLIGNRSHISAERITITPLLNQEANNNQAAAKTVVFVAEEMKVVAIIAISDKLKPGSSAAIKKLKEAGIDIVMLTGDNKQTAAAISSQLGAIPFKAELLPAEKAEFVKLLQSQGKIVAMVGDGINDSHALSQADISIAMGKGSDIAIDVAKITLITSDLNSIVKALKLSRKTVQTIRQNLFWAFIYNLIGVPIAAGILFPFTGFLLSPMIAGGAMALSSLSVVANSLRLKAIKL